MCSCDCYTPCEKNNGIKQGNGIEGKGDNSFGRSNHTKFNCRRKGRIKESSEKSNKKEDLRKNKKKHRGT
jgi:hypothetical protein